MIALVNGAEVLSMRLTMPAQGVWVLSAELAAEEPVTGALTLEQGGVALAGTVLRSGVVAGSCRIEAVGGAGGLRVEQPARSYQGVTARAVLDDILATAGERLDASSSRPALAETLSYWTRVRGRGSEAVASLAAVLGVSWRVLASGAVWLGPETWSKPSGYEYEVIDRDAGGGNVLVAPETIGLFPGMTLGDDRVGRVEHVLSEESPLRTTFWTVDA